MKSKVTKVTGNGSWNGSHGTMYSFGYEFEDGVMGLANHTTPESKYKIGDEVEYEINGQDKLQNNRIKFIQSDFNRFSNKQEKNTASFALSYAKDLVVSETITLEQVLPLATKFNEWLKMNG